MAPQRIGGSFAPSIDSSTLSRYTSICESAPEEAGYYMDQLCGMITAYLKESPSKNAGTPHPVGVGLITTLEEEQVKRLWDVVPWPKECDAMQACFEELPLGEVRNAAFHLLWYAKELSEDRQPYTNNMLPESVRKAGEAAKRLREEAKTSTRVSK